MMFAQIKAKFSGFCICIGQFFLSRQTWKTLPCTDYDVDPGKGHDPSTWSPFWLNGKCICPKLQNVFVSNCKMYLLIMMLTQAEDMIEVHDPSSLWLNWTDPWIKCHTMHWPTQVCVLYFGNQKNTQWPTNNCMCFGIITLMEQFWSVCGSLGHSVNDRRSFQKTFLDFYEWWYCWCDSHLGGMW